MQQMEMFKEGGLKDEGGTKDPVSGNDVPSGSLKEEVRDDIDAKLSPGEFVFPADVVRFIGLQKLMQMRDKAKAGLQRMEDMGQMGNSDEAIIDDDVPFGTTDLIIMAGPAEEEMNKLNIGGMPTQQQQSNQAGGVPGQGRFDQIVGQPQFNYEVKKFRNETGAELFIPFVGNNPVYQAPPGYTEVTQEQQQQELADPTLPQATVQTELGQSGVELDSGMGDSVGDVGYSDMTDTEKADFGDAARGVGPAGAFGKAAIGFGSGMLDASAGMFSAGPLGKAVEFGVEKVTGAKPFGRALSAFKDAQIEDAISRSKSRELMSPRERARQRARDTQIAADRAAADYDEAMGSPPGTSVGVGTSQGPMAVDATTGMVTDPTDGAVQYGRTRDEALAALSAQTLGAQEAGMSDTSGTVGGGQQMGGGPQTEAEAKGGRGTGGTGQGSGPVGGPRGGPDPTGMGGGPQSDAEAGGGTEQADPDDSDHPGDSVGGSDYATGGLIPKKKKQKKKKKRSGLASR